MDYKRLALIGGFILVAVGIGYGLYYFFFKPAPAGPPVVEQPTVQPTLPPTGGPVTGPVTGPVVPPIVTPPVVTPPTAPSTPPVAPSPIAQGGLTTVRILTQTPATVPTINKIQGGVNVYDPRAGKFYRIKDGQQTLLTDKQFYSVSSITWNSNGDQAILGYPDGSKLLYNFRTNQQATLPKEITDPAFNRDGSRIGYKWITDNPDSNWIGTASGDGSNIKLVEPLGDKGDDVQISWSPASQIVATFREGSNASSQEVFFIGLSGENFRSLSVPGRGFESQWSPDGQRLLYSVYDLAADSNPTLYVVDATPTTIGYNNLSLGVKTWSKKCVFSQSVSLAYCAVPRDLPSGSGLYPDFAANSEDDFYRIDLLTGARSLLARPVTADGAKIAADSLTLSGEGTSILFTNRFDGRLLELQLR